MQSTLRASGRPCPLHLRPATRRPLRLVCALSLDRPASNSGRLLSQPKTAERSTNVVTPATASATAAVIDIGAPLQDEATYEAGYDSGYQAGLEAARKAALEGGAAPQVAPAHDSLLRSMVKALSWRFFSTATTIFLAMAFFDASLESALEMGAAEFVSKYLLYLIHERGWIYIKLN